MEKYIKIIDEMAVEAANLYCCPIRCKRCLFSNIANCFDTCVSNFKYAIRSGLAVEKVKEKANESKD